MWQKSSIQERTRGPFISNEPVKTAAAQDGPYRGHLGLSAREGHEALLRRRRKGRRKRATGQSRIEDLAIRIEKVAEDFADATGGGDVLDLTRLDQAGEHQLGLGVHCPQADELQVGVIGEIEYFLDATLCRQGRSRPISSSTEPVLTIHSAARVMRVWRRTASVRRTR